MEEEKLGPKRRSGLGQNERLGGFVGVGSALMRREGPAPLPCAPMSRRWRTLPAKRASSPSAVAMSLNLNGSSSPISLFNGQQALHFGAAGCLRPTRAERRCQNLATCRHIKSQPGAPQPLPWVLSGRRLKMCSVGEPF